MRICMMASPLVKGRHSLKCDYSGLWYIAPQLLQLRCSMDCCHACEQGSHLLECDAASSLNRGPTGRLLKLIDQRRLRGFLRSTTRSTGEG